LGKFVVAGAIVGLGIGLGTGVFWGKLVLVGVFVNGKEVSIVIVIVAIDVITVGRFVALGC